MDRLEAAIRAELARFGPQGGMPELLAAWPAAVGPMIARNAWPARIARDGTLHVSTSSSTWAFELAQLAPSLVEKLRGELGEGAPKAIRFAVGIVPETGPPAAETEAPPPLEPAPEALREAAELAAGVGDAELRERIARAAALSLSRGRSDTSV